MELKKLETGVGVWFFTDVLQIPRPPRMAAITNRFLPLRLNTHPVLRPIIHHVFTPSDPAIPQLECEIKPSFFPSNFKEVKASLREQQLKNKPRIPCELISFSNPNPTQSPPFNIAPLEEIRHKLAKFRLRSAAPTPKGSSAKFITFQELCKRNVISTPYDSEKTSVGSAAGGRLPFDAIRENLRQLRATVPATENRNGSTGKTVDPSLARLKDSLKLKASGSMAHSPVFTVGSGHLPSLVFGSGKENDGNDLRMELVKYYDYPELGKKLEMLRPEKRKRKWFSLQELKERLVKLRKIEEEERKRLMVGDVTFKDLRECMLEARLSVDEKARKKTMLKLEILGSLGETPGFMKSPLKEHLVKKYFHPDHMSAAEKLRLELKKVRAEFKTSESDCGSARVQVAQLTTKIKHLATVLHKKDKHSRKGLQAMVQRRKKLLKYLRRTDWDSYSMVLSKLGLRDNPDTKA